ncbi:MAG: hypothetical protein EXS05_13700 [Planctomycetaceae bacterium]|nr:hypothetical protein [Planctomycetaceae bacterium]
MREASTLTLSPEAEEIDGMPTYMLKSRGKFGEHTVWIDPAHGGLPRRIEIRKQLGDLYDGNQLGSRIGLAKEPLRKPGQGLPNMQPPDIRAFSLRIDNVQIENKEGVFVLTAWKATEKITFGDGRSGDRQTELSVSAVDFKPETLPDDAYRPEIEIPDKTTVQVTDGLAGTQYEWVGGKIQVRGGN